MHIIDTNILIYYSKDDSTVVDFILSRVPARNNFIIPTIVIVEFLCFPSIGAVEQRKFEAIIRYCNILDLTHDIALYAADIRKIHHLSLADSVIAATALLTASPLVTRNVKDFQNVKNLELIKL